MPDNKKIRHPLDNKRIDIKDPKEIRNWCNALNVSEDVLKKAVREVGTSGEAVRMYLEK
jgi:hypothetical protein